MAAGFPVSIWVYGRISEPPNRSPGLFPSDTGQPQPVTVHRLERCRPTGRSRRRRTFEPHSRCELMPQLVDSLGATLLAIVSATINHPSQKNIRDEIQTD